MSPTLAVLVVEDDDIWLRSFIRSLVRAASADGLRVEFRTAGSLGAARAERAVPDVAILDVHLPDGGALELLEDWRASRRFQHVPVLVASSSIDDVAHRCRMLRAWSVPKLPSRAFLECAIDLMREAAARPRTLLEAAAQVAAELGDEAKFSEAERTVLAQRIAGRSLREIAQQRGTSYGTVKNQSKSALAKLRETGLAGRLAPALLADLLEDRADGRP